MANLAEGEKEEEGKEEGEEEEEEEGEKEEEEEGRERKVNWYNHYQYLIIAYNTTLADLCTNATLRSGLPNT